MPADKSNLCFFYIKTELSISMNNISMCWFSDEGRNPAITIYEKIAFSLLPCRALGIILPEARANFVR